MSRKKIFGVSADLNRGFSETIALIEKNDGKFRNTTLPLSRIELDPENPRKLHFDLNDARNGLNKSDIQYPLKYAEQLKLQELAETIKSSGIINPIVVYKNNDFYRVVAGERRCLASILAGRSEIDARVFNDKPKGFSLKLLQWVENTAREDLSLNERIENIKDIFSEYKKQNPGTVLTTGLLEKITGLSNARASQYCSAINAPQNILNAIKTGEINNLQKAVLISNVADGSLRDLLLKQCIDGASMVELQRIIKEHKSSSKLIKVNDQKKRGRSFTKVNFGHTTNLNTAKTLIELLLQSNKFKQIPIKISDINSFDQATKVFKQLLNKLEKEI